MVNGAPSRQVRGYFCHKEETPNSTLHPYYIHGHQLKHVDHSNRASITVENISQFSQDCL